MTCIVALARGPGVVLTCGVVGGCEKTEKNKMHGELTVEASKCT